MGYALKCIEKKLFIFQIAAKSPFMKWISKSWAVLILARSCQFEFVRIHKVRWFLDGQKTKFAKKIDPILTREPGGTKSAELIRSLILKDYFKKSKKEKFDKYTDTLLYLAARNEHIKNVIYPALKKKKVIISDRFTDTAR